ncbi:MBL fold metallo-hydrolase [uncultured Sphaerochaeta sp.]|uniref:MBL fold metallo-hydrolase n=1 Tax=uncultured Sphaerochaeta sp. TaxID=886478 RepID=UPI002A0A93C7|nr:MBL fold metallo-hydrolase [uncultured Sphaerochaeta sp.]
MNILSLSKTNCYVLRSKEGTLLIDTGYSYDKKRFLSLCKKQGISCSDIDYVFLTHHHDDHCGLVNFLVEQNPRIRVVMHGLCADLVAKGVNATEYGGKWASPTMKVLAGMYGKLDRNWTLSFPAYQVREIDILLDFPTPSISRLGYTIIFTPGHTPDSISLLDDEGNLFVGDAASNYLQFAQTRYAPPFLTDLKQFYLSWETLLTFPVHRIYPAHGKSFAPGALRKNLNALKEEHLPLYIIK